MLDNLKPGDVVYTKLDHVSRSGMTRGISLYIIKDNEPYDVSWLAAEKMGDKLHKKGGIKVGGCGMDMGFYLVYNLGRTLFPDGFGEECTNTDCKLRPVTKEHLDQYIFDDCEFSGRNGDKSGWDNDGGYALTHRWL